DLAAAQLLARPQEDGAGLGDERRVVGVDRVRVAVGRAFGEKDLGAGTGEQVAQRLVLARDRGRVRLRAPPVLAPGAEVVSVRRAHEHPPQRGRHVLQAEAAFGGGAHPKNAFATSYHSGGTVFSSLVASSSETSTIRSPWSAAIRPNVPASARSAALRPKRVAS